MKSTVVDPWRRDSEETGVEEITQDSSMCFEDSFVADSIDNLEEAPPSRLPDSAEYLASLESKLERLKSKRKGKDIVKSLEERNKSSMMNFLSNGNQSVLDDDDFILDTPVGNSHPIMRYVAPDKQALTLGELVELLKADHLAQVLEQHDSAVDSDEEKKSQETPN